jgi:hypothetical protein
MILATVSEQVLEIQAGEAIYKIKAAAIVSVGVEQIDPYLESIKLAVKLCVERNLYYSRKVDLTKHYI